MIKFILFLKKIHFVLIFILLEALAIHYYANSTSYTRAKLVTASNRVVGGIYAQISGINSFFHLKRENGQLNAQIAVLRTELSRYHRRETMGLTRADSSVLIDTMGVVRYTYRSARVINNSIIRQQNYITLDRGVADGLQPDMAVIADGGIAGYVLGCSEHFSVCMSLLNTAFRTSGKIKGNDYFGSVYWDGESYDHVMLSEIPKYAVIHRGDTIVTTSHSSRFPPDVMIGTVESYTLNNATYYDVRVKIKANIAALNNVLAVKYEDAEEREALENDIMISEQQQDSTPRR